MLPLKHVLFLRELPHTLCAYFFLVCLLFYLHSLLDYISPLFSDRAWGLTGIAFHPFSSLVVWHDWNIHFLSTHISVTLRIVKKRIRPDRYMYILNELKIFIPQFRHYFSFKKSIFKFRKNDPWRRSVHVSLRGLFVYSVDDAKIVFRLHYS